ncbi:fused PTS fructose transporter subunit IIA/HPr protein [Vibrio sp. VB16]|uniref:fused PTS fructose transporter subunit IIA/HPr protein n=1 Tax=Vibrio sp. VB16 TaxID=2785746 RepID=UPI00189E60DB|nr:fused PTS fructose transporter subunit IIA/HPr protein [Vibrio sp. VB16]UGA57585.1 fused PTS fructose transporter subunit IIA/HPr protein [Vibrio sp. VB16]
MLKLTTLDIELQQTAIDKSTAIRVLASDLAKKGLVEVDYVEGMLNREAQNTTFLGNGIAIPHGTTDTRHLVKSTGVAVHHFPQGVDWEDGNTIYIAIGIAAKSDEHLGILKQLTKVLSADGVEDKLRDASTKQEILALLNGDVQFTADFDESLILQNFPASDMIQLSAVAGGLLKNTHSVEASFIADLVSKKPTYLGKGLWLISSVTSVSRTAMSVVTVDPAFSFEDKPVNGLIAFSVCNAAHQTMLDTISELVFQQKQTTILQATKQELVSLFTQDDGETSAPTTSDNNAVFKIKNAHGLHARPGAMLVAEAKKFESIISVKNLDGDGKTVNAKSLMKVIGLGVMHGHSLAFSAEGIDAGEAIKAIGIAIESGLGEG